MNYSTLINVLHDGMNDDYVELTKNASIDYIESLGVSVLADVPLSEVEEFYSSAIQSMELALALAEEGQLELMFSLDVARARLRIAKGNVDRFFSNTAA